MGFTIRKYIIIVILAIIVLAAVPLTLYLIARPQTNRSKASASTSLSLIPATVTVAQHQQFSLDVSLNAGENLPSIVDVYVQYDPKLVRFIRVDKKLPIGGFMKQPNVMNGVMNYSYGSMFSTQENYFQGDTKIQTIIFEALAPGQATISLDATKTRVLSMGINDAPGENVLSNTVPAQITINQSDIIPTITVPADAGNSARMFLLVDMPGIASTSAVIRANRTGTLYIYDKTNTEVGRIPVSFNFKGGDYTAEVLWPGANSDTEVYTLKIQMDNSLTKTIPGIYNLKPYQTVSFIPRVMLVTGDTDSNNQLDATDYKVYTDCITLQPGCTADKKLKADLNDDGKVDELDLNLFQRGYTIHQGD